MKFASRLAVHGLVVVACIACARPAAAAVTVYDDLANTNNGFFGLGPNGWLAERFKSDPTNLLITDVTVRFSAQTPGLYSLGLYSDVAGVPGVPLANLFTGNTSGGDVHYSTSALTAPSTNYWIVASVPTGVSINSGWGVTTNLSGTGTGFLPLTASSTNQGASWTTNPNVAHQMRVIADVPEPATAALVGIAALSTLARRRRDRPTGNVVTPCPRLRLTPHGGPGRSSRPLEQRRTGHVPSGDKAARRAIRRARAVKTSQVLDPGNSLAAGG